MSTMDGNEGVSVNLSANLQLDTSLCASLGLGSETSEKNSPLSLNEQSLSFSSYGAMNTDFGRAEIFVDTQEQGVLTWPFSSVDGPKRNSFDRASSYESHESASEMEVIFGKQQYFLSPIAVKRESFDSSKGSIVTDTSNVSHWSPVIEWAGGQSPSKEGLNHGSPEKYKAIYLNGQNENDADRSSIEKKFKVSENNDTTIVMGLTRPHDSFVGLTLEAIDDPDSPFQKIIEHCQELSLEQDSSSVDEIFLGVLDQLPGRSSITTPHPLESVDGEHGKTSERLENKEDIEITYREEKENITNAFNLKHGEEHETQILSGLTQAFEGTEANRSCSTSYYSDLTSAKKHVDASSLMFIERLRGAAHRRKLEVTRSRDSLAAKERQQLISIAESRERQRQALADVKRSQASKNSYEANKVTLYTARGYTGRPFKARPMIQSGNWGQAGVPKVEKKPTTIPFSPQIGAKRQQRLRVPALEKGHGGQFGVPKVEKRNTTVPVSPQLGVRRTGAMVTRSQSQPSLFDPISTNSRKSEFLRKIPEKLMHGMATSDRTLTGPREWEGNETHGRVLSRTSSTPNLNISLSSLESITGLRGLDLLSDRSSLLDSPDALTRNCENAPPANVTPRVIKKTSYVPYSTVRAKKRADFDARRAENESRTLARTKAERKSLLIEKRQEVNKLRESLRSVL